MATYEESKPFWVAYMKFKFYYMLWKLKLRSKYDHNR